jgi:beta-phosphoglucomutase
MPLFKAFIFDMNGTMIDDMKYHEKVWYNILVNGLHAPLSYEDVRNQMYGKNEELLKRVFGPHHFKQQQIDTISFEKEKEYQKEYLPHLQLIKGLDALLKKAQLHHIKMAIGTAAIPFNVDFVLDNLHIRPYFDAIITAADVAVSKPAPYVFLKAAQKLGINPADCIVFEDAPKGIEAARRAGMQAVAITSYHTADELKADNVLYIINDYTDKCLDGILGN